MQKVAVVPIPKIVNMSGLMLINKKKITEENPLNS